MILKKCFALIFILSLSTSVFAQVDSLLLSLDNGKEEKTPLLPKKMMFTQRLFWGEKGLLRITGIAPKLTDEGRTKELKIRRAMLVTHQVLGYLTLGGMIGQGIVGTRLYRGEFDLLPLHKNLSTAVSIGYFTTASLSMFSPPPMLNRKGKSSTAKWHKRLAYIHFSAMVATLILAERASEPAIKPYHRAAAFTAFGAYTVSMVVMTF